MTIPTNYPELAVLLEHEYAARFFAIKGRYPRWVPTCGSYPEGRMWRRYYEGGQ